MRRDSSRRLMAVVLLSSAVLAGCAPSRSALPSQRRVRADIVPPAIEVQGSYPTSSTVGLPSSVALEQWTGPLMTSEADLPVQNIDGRECQVIDGYRFDLIDDEQLRVDSPCLVLRNASVSTTGDVSAMVVQANTNRQLFVEDSVFDGGPNHARGVLGHLGEIVVRRSAFYRFGNAAIEVNDRSGSSALTVERSFLYEAKGWPRDQHVDGIQMAAGGSLVVRNNTVIIEPFGAAADNYDYTSNAAIGIGATLGDVGDVLIEGNLLAGGGRVIYLQEKGFTFRGAVTVRDNVFDQRFSPVGGIWGPLYPGGLPAALDWSNNSWADGTAMDLNEALTDSP